VGHEYSHGVAQAAAANASAIQLGTTIRHVGIAGSNPLAPTIPNRCRELYRHGRRERVSAAYRPHIDLLAPPNDQAGVHWIPQPRPRLALRRGRRPPRPAPPWPTPSARFPDRWVRRAG
jgi:hypothetical protein